MLGRLSIHSWDQIKLWLLTAILFSMPVSHRVSTILIITLAAITVLALLSRRESPFDRARWPVWIPASFYLVALLGLTYTTNLKSGLALVETQASLLIFPFIFSCYKINEGTGDHLRKAFIVALTGYVVLLEFWIVYRMTQSGDYRLFSYYYTYENAATEFFVQPVYFGVFVVLAIVFCIGVLLKDSRVGQKVFYSACALLLCFFLFQLAVRGPLIAGGAILSLYLFRICFERRKWVMGLLLVAVMLGSFFFLFHISNFLKLRMQDFITELTATDIKSIDPLSRRLIWPASWEVFTDNWLLGTGTGDGETTLREEYRDRHLDELYGRNLNAHNEYLTQLMRYGLLGLVPLFLNLVFSMVVFVRARNVEAVLFTLLIAWFFLTETVFNRSQGVMFTSFFLCFFLSSTAGHNANSAVRD
jgi:O-antigen ligase